MKRLIFISSIGLIALVPPAAAQNAYTGLSFERSFFVQPPLSQTVEQTGQPATDPPAPATEVVETVSPQEVAQEVPPTPAQAPPETPPAPPDPTFSPRLGARYVSPSAGFDQLVGIEGFIPLFQIPAQNITFLEGRAFYQPDESTFGGNAVIGYRTYNATNSRIFGGYVAYDNRNTGNSVFHQIGAGLETLGDDWDARVNAYLPVGTTRNTLLETFSSGFFQQNNLLLNRLEIAEAAMAGFDVEYGRKLLTFGQTGVLRGYLGLYYYGGNEGDSALGGRLRLAARVSNYASVGLTVQHDSLFDTRAIVNLAVNIPSSTPPRASTFPAVAARLGESVERTIGITVDDQRQRDLVVARSSVTGQPIQFIHVDLGTAGGNGTFESPLGSSDLNQVLAGAAPGSVLYVRSGTNPGIPGFTIPTGVSVLSTAPQQTIDTQQLRGVSLPLAGTGVRPEVTGTVVVNSNTALSGFSITPGAAAGVTGDNIQNVAISNNLINSPGQTVGQGGINLGNATGDVVITNNTVAFPAVPAETVTFTDVNGTQTPVRASCGGPCFTDVPFPSDFETAGGSSGIRLFNSSGATNLTLSGNTVSNAVSNGVLVGVSGDAQINANIANNTTNSNQGAGLFVFGLDQSRTTVNFTGNTSIGNQGRIFNESGIRFATFNNAQATVTATGNTTNNNRGQGIFVGLNDNSEATATITGNTAIGNIGNGIFLGSRVTSRVFGIISDNTISGTIRNPDVIPPTFPTGHGIFIGTQESGLVSATAVNNTSNNNERSGIFFFVAANGRGTVNIFNNTANNNGASGIEANVGVPLGSTAPPAAGTVQGTLNILNNTVIDNRGTPLPGEDPSNTAGGGIVVRSINNAGVRATIQGNTVNTNATDPEALAGIGLLSAGNSDLRATVQFNSFLGQEPSTVGQNAGFTGESVGDSRLCLLLTNNTSNKPFFLLRISPTSTFQADSAGNAGPPVITPLFPIQSLTPTAATPELSQCSTP